MAGFFFPTFSHTVAFPGTGFPDAAVGDTTAVGLCQGPGQRLQKLPELKPPPNHTYVVR